MSSSSNYFDLFHCFNGKTKSNKTNNGWISSCGNKIKKVSGLNILTKRLVVLNSINGILDQERYVFNCDKGTIIQLENGSKKPEYMFSMSTQNELLSQSSSSTDTSPVRVPIIHNNYRSSSSSSNNNNNKIVINRGRNNLTRKSRRRKRTTKNKKLRGVVYSKKSNYGAFECIDVFPTDINISIIRNNTNFKLNGTHINEYKSVLESIIKQCKETRLIIPKITSNSSKTKNNNNFSEIEESSKVTIIYGVTKLELFHLNTLSVVLVVPLIVRDQKWLLQNNVFSESNCRINNVILCVAVNDQAYLMNHKGHINNNYNIHQIPLIKSLKKKSIIKSK